MPSRKPKATAKKEQTPQVPEPVVMETDNGEKIVTADPTAPERKLVYKKLDIREFSTASEHGPTTPEWWKVVLKWETEEEAQERQMKLYPGTTKDNWAFGDVYHCLDRQKRKVRCWNNANNRPFDQGWCDDLIHTLLVGQWAGPLTIPGETVNGETVRISKYGMVLSGQHQGTACILADEDLQKSRIRMNQTVNSTQSRVGQGQTTTKIDGPVESESEYPAWDGHEHVVLETIVITGMSEDERVLRTIDYVKPRSTADMLFTMPLYRKRNSVERKELTRMLASALEMLWDRTDTRGYKTHPEMAMFLDRHKGHMLDAVEHVFMENLPFAEDGRLISKLYVNAGHASAMAYLMGSSGPKTNSDVYRTLGPPAEKGLDSQGKKFELDWSLWDHALLFWLLLARAGSMDPKRKDLRFEIVRKKIGLLLTSDEDSENNQGLGGKPKEKLAVIAKAWDIWKELPPDHDTPFSEADLEPDGELNLSYTRVDATGKELPDGQVALIDQADFGGIDLPEGIGGKKRDTRAPMGVAPTPAQIAQGEELEQARWAEKGRSEKGRK